jgi:hypothetical protein
MLELLQRPNTSNLSAQAEAAAKNNYMYDVVLYLAVVLHIILLFVFLSAKLANS